MDKEKVLDFIRKLANAITILGPAIIAVMGVFDLAGIPIAEGIYKILIVVLDAAATVASIVFDMVDKKQKAISDSNS